MMQQSGAHCLQIHHVQGEALYSFHMNRRDNILNLIDGRMRGGGLTHRVRCCCWKGDLGRPILNSFLMQIFEFKLLILMHK